MSQSESVKPVDLTDAALAETTVLQDVLETLAESTAHLKLTGDNVDDGSASTQDETTASDEIEGDPQRIIPKLLKRQLAKGESTISLVATSSEPADKLTNETAVEHHLHDSPGAIEAEDQEPKPPKMDAKDWITVMFLLDSEKDLLGVARSCKALKSLFLDPFVLGTWLMRRSTTYLALFDAYQSHPRLLTVEVVKSMISMGAHIPRYLAYIVGRDYHDALAAAESNGNAATTSKEPSHFFSTPSDNSDPSNPIPNVIEEADAPLIKHVKGLPLETVKYLLWSGTQAYGTLVGFDADAAVSAFSGTSVGQPKQESPEVVAARMKLYKETLEWVYNAPGARLPGSPVSDSSSSTVASIAPTPTSDAEVFVYLLDLYRSATPGNSMSLSTPTQPAPASPQIWGKKGADRNRIVASLRELANVFRFTPGMVYEKLGDGWLPADMFERDVELAWFLVRHSGVARKLLETQKDEITYRTLLGYRIHVNLNHPTLPLAAQDEHFPFQSIQRLLLQSHIQLTDVVLMKLVWDHTSATVLTRLVKFVSKSRLSAIGERLLQECFEGPALEAAMASGYTAKPLQKADALIKCFGFNKEVIARCFMGTPRIWGAFKDATILPTADGGEGGGSEEGPTQVLPFDVEVGMLTRQAQATGALPWVSWQWAVSVLGADHPVASACLHDVCLRAFSDPAPLNPGSHEGLSFARREADKAVKALIGMGVIVRMCTAAAAMRRALWEIEVATASGEAAQAMRVQAAQLRGGKGRMAQQVVAAAAAAGNNAISRRYIYVMADVEKMVLTSGPDEYVAVGGLDIGEPMPMIEVSEEDARPPPMPTLRSSASSLSLKIDVDVSAANEGAKPPTSRRRYLVPLYPPTLMPQHRSVWLMAIRNLIVDHKRWKAITTSPVSPNACRRFYVAASNIVRGLEQFGVPAAALAVLRTKNPGGKALKSMSSEEIDETMLYGVWVNEIDGEDVDKGKK
ncbi:hypothetical protein HDU76_002834 [Blyttiomyces sp. JEL0837]|nr:hypothetical protein HDU76_002834 [Blyttiomyces sp. JEL0837]